jgi:transposase
MSKFFMGCDVSKGYGDFVVLDHVKRVVVSTFQFDDTADGHAALCEFLSKFNQTHLNTTLHVGVESTGGYENNWFALFKRLGEMYPVKVTRLNPLAVKAHHDASMKRNGTDDISAFNIASYLIAYPELVDYEQDGTFSGLRKQWKFIELLKKQKVQLSNQLGFVLYQSHPELVRYCKDGTPDWILQLLKEYPTAKKLSRAKVKTVAQIPHIDEIRAKALIEGAQRSIASHCSESDNLVISGIVRQIISLDSTIGTQKKFLEKNCDIPEVNLLCTIDGIGKYSAIGLMMNIVCIARFCDVKKLSSYFGLHPVYRQSGDGISGFHMSKKGRAEPRAILYMAVLSALNCNPLIKKLYDKCKAQGMESKAAIGVCMHKMLRIIYGMLKTNECFSCAIDEKNQKKIVRIGPDMHQKKKRRLQAYDKAAPISKRQSKKRLKIEQVPEPQRTLVSKNGVDTGLFVGENNNRHKDPKGSCPQPVTIGELVEKELVNVNCIIHN